MDRCDAINALYAALRHMKIRRDVYMRDYTSFRIGGRAALFLEALREDEIELATGCAREFGVPCLVFGNGTNLLVTDEDIPALFIRIGDGLSDISFDGDRAYAQAGAGLTALARRSVAAGFMGLEWAAGIPGSVGGAVAMNAGAYGGEIGDTLCAVTILREGAVSRVCVSDGDMGYRSSAFAYPSAVVLSAEFKLQPDDGRAGDNMAEYTKRRTLKQPLSYPSAGSVFKRPAGNYAGALIEGCGLKGVSCGGAMVSELHAGFIVNTGDATFEDVVALMELIKTRVERETGVVLEPEVRIIDSHIL